MPVTVVKEFRGINSTVLVLCDLAGRGLPLRSTPSKSYIKDGVLLRGQTTCCSLEPDDFTILLTADHAVRLIRLHKVSDFEVAKAAASALEAGI